MAAIRGDLPAALERLAFPVLVVEPDARIAWQNEAMRRFVGPRVGRVFGDPIVPEERRAVRERVLADVNRGEPDEFEVHVRARDGTVHRAEVSTAPLVEDGHVVGMFGVVRVQDAGETPRGAKANLTPRQLQVLRLLARGYSTEQVADELGISVDTMRNHVRGILRGLGVHSRIAAVVRAHELGIV